ncbi:hypothetical protein HanXRQr2_Chr03g0096271 [Helianthus annuus]|uniref:Uncharacterized protein n=1 Tax=Helianthus annuus TaxID=4232 RepID=A0A9K3JD19_HELAN|nr:hypothetical protein HanXRQr2_Chr03g0096271 [Helianthus annuus]KAJ0942515.1 hypothetical protein HanPSC8_Chr03g0092831 [Helianthus annuus]
MGTHVRSRSKLSFRGTILTVLEILYIPHPFHFKTHNLKSDLCSLSGSICFLPERKIGIKSCGDLLCCLISLVCSSLLKFY